MSSNRTRPLAALARFYRLVLLGLSMPVVLGEYLHPSTGSQYGVTTFDKLVLIAKMVRNNVAIPTGSTFLEHLVIATKVLSVPADVEGKIVECGGFKGGSTANLSLVADLCGRTLAVFDSFEGMPEPDETDSEHMLLASEQVHTYEAGAWSATASELRSNVDRYGELSVCEIYPGLFDETMPGFDESVALAFIDVGLRASAEDAVRHLWPNLNAGGYLFTHDAKHVEVASLFFDDCWWNDHLDEPAPNLVGAGNGLGLHPTPNGFSSLLAYTVKQPESLAFREVVDDGIDNVVGPNRGD